jgi:hypothetical protein
MPTIDLPISPNGPIISVAIFVSFPRLLALRAGNALIPQFFFGIALLDTGASHTVIDTTVATALALTPTGSVSINTPSTGMSGHVCNTFDVSLWFRTQPPSYTSPTATHPSSSYPPHPARFTLPVIESDLSAQNIHALIGRDVLDQCEFLYYGRNGRFRLIY